MPGRVAQLQVGLEELLERLMERAVLSALQGVATQGVIREAVRKEFMAIRDELPLPATEETLSVEDAARIAHVTGATIRDWIHRRILTAERAGSKYVITRAALKAAMALPSGKRPDIIDIDAEASKIVALNRKNQS